MNKLLILPVIAAAVMLSSLPAWSFNYREARWIRHEQHIQMEQMRAAQRMYGYGYPAYYPTMSVPMHRFAHVL